VSVLVAYWLFNGVYKVKVLILIILSVDELQGLFNVIKSEITARTVAKTLGMMIQTPKNSSDTVVRESVVISNILSDITAKRREVVMGNSANF
jgi:hypothetical protein